MKRVSSFFFAENVAPVLQFMTVNVVTCRDSSLTFARFCSRLKANLSDMAYPLLAPSWYASTRGALTNPFIDWLLSGWLLCYSRLLSHLWEPQRRTAEPEREFDKSVPLCGKARRWRRHRLCTQIGVQLCAEKVCNHDVMYCCTTPCF